MENTKIEASASFQLDESEGKLLEEFGTLMSAEYNYIYLAAE